jgi:hypothetical protein
VNCANENCKSLFESAWRLELPSSHKLVLLKLIDLCDVQSRETTIPVGAIAADTGLSIRSVQSAIKALAGAEIIESVSRPGRATIYVLCLSPTPAEFAPPQNLHPRRICTPDGGGVRGGLSIPTSTEVFSFLSPITEGKEKEPPLPPESAFEAFWQAYPRRIGKGAALRAWQKITSPRRTLQAIVAALQWQVLTEQWTRDGGRFIPHPATYLNQTRWLDEPEADRRLAATSSLVVEMRALEQLEQDAARTVDCEVDQ